MRRTLAEAGYEVQAARFWPWLEKVKAAVADIKSFADENSEFRSYERWNFMQCYSAFSSGEYLEDEKGNGYAKKYSCGNKYCFWCSTRKRDGQANEHYHLIMQAHVKHGLNVVWRIQATLPEQSREKILNNEGLSNKIRKEFVLELRKLFGFKTRENMAEIGIPHPVGDSDLLGDHWHWHFVVVPLAFDKEGKPKVSNIKRLDLDILRKAWASVLKNNGIEESPINPQVQYHDLKNAKGRKRLRRGLRYDERSFAKDFEKSVVGMTENKLVIKGERYDGGEKYDTWRIVTPREYAERWIWLRDRNRIEVYGWLRTMKRMYERGLFEAQPEPEAPAIVHREDCTIEIVREKVWNDKMKKVVWRREEWCRRKTGEKYLVGQEVKWFYGKII